MEKLHNLVKMALEKNSSIVVDRVTARTVAGFTTEYMASLGLTKGNLKRLERAGLALRGYSKNIWVPGETLPNGKVVLEGRTYRAKGHRTMWILIADGA